MSCDVKNVIYVIKSNGCKELYIGQTGDKLRARRTIHAQQIRDPSIRQIPLSEHIDNCSRSIPKFQMFPFFKMHTESISARLANEKHFIRCFNMERLDCLIMCTLYSSCTRVILLCTNLIRYVQNVLRYAQNTFWYVQNEFLYVHNVFRYAQNIFLILFHFFKSAGCYHVVCICMNVYHFFSEKLAFPIIPIFYLILNFKEL